MQGDLFAKGEGELREGELVARSLPGGAEVRVGRLPGGLLLDPVGFRELWDLHPDEFPEIHLHGRRVKTPRWQQAYGEDYHFSGQTTRALALPAALAPFLEWGRERVDRRLNGVLLNWYEGSLGHYIGRHRDSVANMIEGAPIVTISLGERRVFRLRPWKGAGKTDFEARDGSVIVIPYETNLGWTHEVPASKRLLGRRISITLRAFRSSEVDA